MNTFLPLPSYSGSALTLDDLRLRNQVKECAQIIASLEGGAYIVVGDVRALYSTGGFPAHPATLMWSDHRHHLCRYALACVEELRQRGSQAMRVYETMFVKLRGVYEDGGPPSWLGNERLHSSHRSQLLAKDPQHYGRWGWGETPGKIEYWWPLPSGQS